MKNDKRTHRDYIRSRLVHLCIVLNGRIETRLYELLHAGVFFDESFPPQHELFKGGNDKRERGCVLI